MSKRIQQHPAPVSDLPAGTAEARDEAAPLITITPFRQFPPDQDHPSRRIEAAAQFAWPGGTALHVKVCLFVLDDGRIGVGVYPSPDRGTVLRWDAGPSEDPSVIFWEAPHCDADQCGSPCGHRDGTR